MLDLELVASSGVSCGNLCIGPLGLVDSGPHEIEVVAGVTARTPVSLERIRHVPRELLRSRDFRDALETDAQLQWWHQRAVHDSFGVVEGLSVDRAADAESVVVAPGLAFDCFGRELQLFEHRVVPLPEDAAPMTLLARNPQGGSAEAELVWRETTRVDHRAGVPLAVRDETGELESRAVLAQAARAGPASDRRGRDAAGRDAVASLSRASASPGSPRAWRSASTRGPRASPTRPATSPGCTGLGWRPLRSRSSSCSRSVSSTSRSARSTGSRSASGSASWPAVRAGKSS